MKQIIEYINEKYSPLSVILYGSYANGTNNLNSDFDALVISADDVQHHDTSFVDGVQLDLFVYPATFFDGGYDPEDFVQIFDGQIIADSEGLGENLQNRVKAYIQNRPKKTRDELKADIDWCAKMLERTKRQDAEGMFRWHWVLKDSLEIFCDIMQQPYFGPKKALKWMEENHPEAFEIYSGALREFTQDSLEDWIEHIKKAGEN